MRIFRWTLKDEFIWLLLWCIGASAIVSFIIALYPSMGEIMKGFLDKEVIIKAFMGRYASELVNRSYFDVWLCLEFFGWFGVLVGIYPLVFASTGVSGEIERHTMEILVTRPVSRVNILLEKFLAIMVNLAVICLVGFSSLSIAAALFVDDPASHAEYFLIMFNIYSLLFALAAFGFLCAVVINEMRLALSITIGAAVAGFLIYKVTTAAGVALWLARLTPYYYADATKILATGTFNWSDNAILGVTGVVLLAVAIIIFDRKDITD